MFDISFGELMIVAIGALVVLGPEEMPNAMRSVMRFLRSLKSMASEVQREIESLAEEKEILEVRRTLEAERRYIIDEAGNYQEVFDLSDLMSEKEKEETRKQPPEQLPHE